MASASIDHLRARFEVELSANPQLYHPIDVDRVRTEQWQVHRFLLDQPDGSEERAFEAMCTALQWKCSFGVHERSDQYFPEEFWTLNGVNIAGHTRTGGGVPIMWGTIRNKRAFRETSLLAKQFSAHVIEKIDREGGEKGFAIVTDDGGSGLGNVDLDHSRFNGSLLDRYYPQALRAMYIVDEPWLLHSIMKVIASFMSPERRRLLYLVKQRELATYIDPKYIPVNLGGKRERNCYPPNLVPLRKCYTQYGTMMDERFVEQFYDFYREKLKQVNGGERMP